MKTIFILFNYEKLEHILNYNNYKINKKKMFPITIACFVNEIGQINIQRVKIISIKNSKIEFLCA